MTTEKGGPRQLTICLRPVIPASRMRLLIVAAGRRAACGAAVGLPIKD